MHLNATLKTFTNPKDVKKSKISKILTNPFKIVRALNEFPITKNYDTFHSNIRNFNA